MVVIVIKEVSRSRTTGRLNLSSRIVDSGEYKINLLKVKKYVVAERSKCFLRRHKWENSDARVTRYKIRFLER